MTPSLSLRVDIHVVSGHIGQTPLLSHNERGMTFTLAPGKGQKGSEGRRVTHHDRSPRPPSPERGNGTNSEVAFWGVHYRGGGVFGLVGRPGNEGVKPRSSSLSVTTGLCEGGTGGSLACVCAACTTGVMISSLASMVNAAFAVFVKTVLRSMLKDARHPCPSQMLIGNSPSAQQPNVTNRSTIVKSSTAGPRGHWRLYASGLP